MAKIKKPPVPAKMYRHFAVVTVALTVVLALFAQGENKQFYDEQEQARQVQRSNQESAVAAKQDDDGREAEGPEPAYGRAQISRRDGADGGGSFSNKEYDPSYGRPSGPQGSRYTSVVVPASGSENAGFTASYLEKLSDEELDRLLEAIREDGIETESERTQAIAVMEAASRRRSGHRYN